MNNTVKYYSQILNVILRDLGANDINFQKCTFDIPLQVCCAGRFSKDFPAPDPSVPTKRNLQTSPVLSAENKDVEDPGKGKICHSIPMKMELERRMKPYFWCSCGLSKNQVSYIVITLSLLVGQVNPVFWLPQHNPSSSVWMLHLSIW